MTAGADSGVLKVVRNGSGSARWPASGDPAHPYFWRREPYAYTSGLAATFGAPACRASVDRPDGSVALWLEDADGSPAWTPELLGDVARRLGRTQASHAAALPGDEWLARDWLRAYLVLHEVVPDDALLERLDDAVQTVCHHDFHPANVLGRSAEVVIDWAYCGLGALGLDAGVLVADGLADGAFAVELVDEVFAAVWDGYLAGLRDGGLNPPEDEIRFALARGTAHRLSWLPRGRSPAWDATIDFLERLASQA